MGAAGDDEATSTTGSNAGDFAAVVAIGNGSTLRVADVASALSNDSADDSASYRVVVVIVVVGVVALVVVVEVVAAVVVDIVVDDTTWDGVECASVGNG